MIRAPTKATGKKLNKSLDDLDSIGTCGGLPRTLVIGPAC